MREMSSTTFFGFYVGIVCTFQSSQIAASGVEELRQCKTVSSSWYGVWGKGSEYGVPHTPDFYGVWGKKTFCFRIGLRKFVYTHNDLCSVKRLL